MEPSASSSSSSSNQQSRASSHRRTPSKISLDNLNNFNVEFDPEASTPATHRFENPWHVKFRQNLADRHPRLHARTVRAVRYVRGPRPKEDLPDPRAWLDINVNIKGHRVVIPLESSLIRSTRPFTHPWLFSLLFVGYIIGFAFFARAQWWLTPADSFIDCTSTYWSSNNGCGLNGEDCMTSGLLDFRCPAQCAGVTLANPRTIGDEQMVFVPLIVGGGDANRTYRGDSFICAAALQSGLISNSKGGCATLQVFGNFTGYLGTTAHGLTSIGFPTIFPLSFSFSNSTSLRNCGDMRNAALALNIVVTFLLFLILRPKAIVLYWSLVCIGYWHVALFSQAGGPPPPLDTAFGTFLPTLFIAYAFWRLAFRFTLPAFLSKAPIEAAVWYVGPFWVGVLTNITMDKIPIDRLTSSDLHKRSGAVTALVIIVLIITVIAVNQVRVIRKTGWLPYYLGWYIAGGLVTLVLALLPGLQLRLHHYILSMVLMPGTGFPTRLSAIYQGFLLGMFLNGGAAFGFDSILQTAADLRQDATLGSDLPMWLTNSTNYNASVALSNQTISWAAPPDGWDGFALLVDDVERYVGSALNFSLAAFESGIPHFFRLALTSADETGDFTRAATLYPNGTWVDPAPGAT